MQLAQSLDSIGKRALAGYLALWGASTAYLALRGADWTFPVVSLLLFACTFGALGWFLTRKSDAPPVAVTAPRFQVAVLLAYLAIYAFVLVGWGLGAIKELVPPGAMREWLVLAYKLLIHVALPAALIAWAGGALADTFDPGLRRKGVVPALLILSGLMFGLLAVVSPSLAELAELGVTGGAILPLGACLVAVDGDRGGALRGIPVPGRPAIESGCLASVTAGRDPDRQCDLRADALAGTVPARRTRDRRLVDRSAGGCGILHRFALSHRGAVRRAVGTHAQSAAADHGARCGRCPAECRRDDSRFHLIPALRWRRSLRSNLRSCSIRCLTLSRHVAVMARKGGPLS
nr:hypothetical protein [Novosphingobium sp.]